MEPVGVRTTLDSQAEGRLKVDASANKRSQKKKKLKEIVKNNQFNSYHNPYGQ